ncbi:TPA: G5 domain-containing protein [Streptococcus suis]|nr:LPXTG cell wall anchor domain-containing protein [Streptococcus suis]HEM5489973.1 G5 domain-containing protein [Streptococcus suis]
MKYGFKRFGTQERKRFRYGIRKFSGLGVASALLGVGLVSAVPVLAESGTATVRYDYVTTDELTEAEKQALVGELPKEVTADATYYLVYRKASSDVLPKTGTVSSLLTGAVGAGLLIIAIAVGRKNKKAVRSAMFLTIVGGSLVVTSASAVTVATLAKYSQTRILEVGSSLPDGKITIAGYDFVGYLGDSENIVQSEEKVVLQEDREKAKEKNEQITKATSLPAVIEQSTVEKIVVDRPVDEATTQVEQATPPIVDVKEGSVNTDSIVEQPVEKPATSEQPTEVAEVEKAYLNKETVTETIKVDEQGQLLTDITGYVLVSTSNPVKSERTVDDILQTVYTVTEIYKKAETTLNEVSEFDFATITSATMSVPTVNEEVISEEIIVSEQQVEESVEVSSSVTTTSGTSVEEGVDSTENGLVSGATDANIGDSNTNTTGTETDGNSQSDGVQPSTTPILPETEKVIKTVEIHTTVRTVRLTEEIPFEVILKEDTTLPANQTVVEQEGQMGQRITVQEIRLVDGVETERNLISENEERAPKNHIIRVGTGSSVIKNDTSVSSSESASTGPTENNHQVLTEAIDKPSVSEQVTTGVQETYSIEINEIILDKEVPEEEVTRLVEVDSRYINLANLSNPNLSQVKIVDIYDPSLQAGTRQLESIQAAYVTLNIRKKQEGEDNADTTELVYTRELPVITKVYKIGTQAIDRAGKPIEKIAVSGYVYNQEGLALEENEVRVVLDGKLVDTIKTDVEGYTYTHLVPNKVYTLESGQFKSQVMAISGTDPLVINEQGQFLLGKRIADETGRVQLNPQIIYLNDAYYQTLEDNGVSVVLSNELDVQVGDVIVIPPTKIYETLKAIKVTKVINQNGQATVLYEQPNIFEVIKDIDIDKFEFDLSEAVFIPSDGVKVIKEQQIGNSTLRSIDISHSLDISGEFDGTDIEGNLTLSKNSIDSEIKVSQSDIDTDLGPFKIEGEVELTIDGKLSSNSIQFTNIFPSIGRSNIDIGVDGKIAVTGKFGLFTDDKMENGKLSDSQIEKINEKLKKLQDRFKIQGSRQFKLGKVQFPVLGSGHVELDLNLEFGIDGSLTVSVSQEVKTGVKFWIKDWVPRLENAKLTREFIFNGLEVEAEAEIGPSLDVGVSLFTIDLFSLKPWAGLGLEASGKLIGLSNYVDASYATTASQLTGLNTGSLGVGISGLGYSVAKDGFEDIIRNIWNNLEGEGRVYAFARLIAELDFVKEIAKLFPNVDKKLKDLNIKHEITLIDIKKTLSEKWGDTLDKILATDKLEKQVKDEYFISELLNRVTNPFTFSSGAGAWGTGLRLQSNGHFEGSFHDSNYGIQDEKSPNGQRFYSNFKGRFTNPELISDNKYKMTLLELSYDPIGKVEYKDGVKLESSYPYGLHDKDTYDAKEKKEFILYLPGAKKSDLEEIVQLEARNSIIDDTLVDYILYNVTNKATFISRFFDFDGIRKVIDEAPNGFTDALSKMTNKTKKAIFTSSSIPGVVSQFGQIVQYDLDSVIDSFNTYQPTTYQLQDVLKELDAISIDKSLSDYDTSSFTNLFIEHNIRTRWIYLAKDKTLLFAYIGGRGGYIPPIIIAPQTEWKLKGDTVIIPTYYMNGEQRVNMQEFAIKPNNKNYSGGKEKSKHYVDSVRFLDKERQDRSLKDWVVRTYLRTMKETRFDVYDYQVQTRKEDGLTIFEVRENHSTPNMQAAGADKNRNPLVATYRQNANGELEKLNPSQNIWIKVANRVNLY